MSKKSYIIIALPIITLIAIGTYQIGAKVSNKIEYKIVEKQQEVIQEQVENKLEVQFITQAPLQKEENWELHEESCEEAALLQAYLYETESKMTKDQANEEILRMIDKQMEIFGEHKDIYTEDMKKFAITYYKLKPEQFQVLENVTLQDIRDMIDKGHPVIVPVVSEYLNNPFYPYPGYHMLVATGYTKTHIITNDNGTKRGKDFSYENSVFEKAIAESIHDAFYLKLK